MRGEVQQPGTVAPGHEGIGAVCGPLRQPDVFDVIGGEYRSLGTRQLGTTIDGDRAYRVDRGPAAPLLAARQMALARAPGAPPAASAPGRPPLAVELTTARLLGALAARVHPGLVLAVACWLALCSVPLAFIGAAVRRLPDVLTGSAFAGTAVLLLAAAAADGTWHVLARAVLGGIALSGFYLVLAVISPSGMCTGNVKAAAGLGSMLAWRGWNALVAGGFAGFLFAALYGTAPDIGRATRKQQIPFGPFMIAGAFLAVLLS
jgi:leader peptidase (prepilin peptidase) / N-methyltransferase